MGEKSRVGRFEADFRGKTGEDFWRMAKLRLIGQNRTNWAGNRAVDKNRRFAILGMQFDECLVRESGLLFLKS